jgi:hypothetical protein
MVPSRPAPRSGRPLLLTAHVRSPFASRSRYARHRVARDRPFRSCLPACSSGRAAGLKWMCLRRQRVTLGDCTAWLLIPLGLLRWPLAPACRVSRSRCGDRGHRRRSRRGSTASKSAVPSRTTSRTRRVWPSRSMETEVDTGRLPRCAGRWTGETVTPLPIMDPAVVATGHDDRRDDASDAGPGCR